MARLTEHHWPGNIRELQNVIERAMILAQGGTLDVPPLGKAAVCDPEPPQEDDLAAVNKAHILAVLQDTGWVVAGPHGAAARLGVKRSTLTYRMKKLGIPAARGRAGTLNA
jgi:transcriptional regulator of acetoin/glycerol metabolism